MASVIISKFHYNQEEVLFLLWWTKKKKHLFRIKDGYSRVPFMPIVLKKKEFEDSLLSWVWLQSLLSRYETNNSSRSKDINCCIFLKLETILG